jgi:hypothetical protein
MVDTRPSKIGGLATTSEEVSPEGSVRRESWVLFNGAYDYNGRGIDNIQPSLDPRSTFADPFYDNDAIREYRYYRYGFAGSADYKFNDAVSVYARHLFGLQGLGR